MAFQLWGEPLLKTEAAQALERLRQPFDLDELDGLLKELLNGIAPEEFLQLAARAIDRRDADREPWLLQSLARGLAILAKRSTRCLAPATELLLCLSESDDTDVALAALDALQSLPAQDGVRARFRALLASEDTLLRLVAARGLQGE